MYPRTRTCTSGGAASGIPNSSEHRRRVRQRGKHTERIQITNAAVYTHVGILAIYIHNITRSVINKTLKTSRAQPVYDIDVSCMYINI